jgi:polysaccharide biosynthesis transport protein
MTVLQFLHVLRARWRLFALVIVLVVGAVAAVNELATRTYTATASVLVDVNSQDPVSGAAPAGAAARSDSYILTQLDVVKSERVALGAIRALKLGDDAQLGYRKAWDKAFVGQPRTDAEYEAWVAEQFAKSLEVSPTRASGVLTVSFKAEHPEVAARVANAVVQSYVDTTLQLRVEPARQSSSFFDERARQLRETLEAAQARLLAYQRSHGVLVAADRLDVESLRLAELSSQLVALQALGIESSSREAQAARQGERMPEVTANPVVAGLNSELSRQQARLSELSSRLGDSHPQVQEATASIAKLREQLGAATRQVSAGMGINNSVNQSRLAQLRNSISEQQQKLLRLRSQQDDAAVLQRDVQNAQKAYDMVLARATQTGLESLNQQTNVAVLKRANVPLKPSSPNVASNLTLGAVLAVIFALCVVLTLELLDRRLRTDADVVDGLGAPLLISLARDAPARSRQPPAAAALLGRAVARRPAGA